jgi:hypothetical protein
MNDARIILYMIRAAHFVAARGWMFTERESWLAQHQGATRRIVWHARRHVCTERCMPNVQELHALIRSGRDALLSYELFYNSKGESD